jgi:hypothetical protein
MSEGSGAGTQATGIRGRLRRVAAVVPGVVVAFFVSSLVLAGTVFLVAVAFFGAGCAFTQEVVKRTFTGTAEMQFIDDVDDDLDPDRDIPDLAGAAGTGGGGGGGGGC